MFDDFQSLVLISDDGTAISCIVFVCMTAARQRFTPESMNFKPFLWIVTACCCLTVSANYTDTTFTDTFFDDVQQRYGKDAVSRFTLWRDLIVKGTAKDDWDRIHLANQFMNRQVTYVSDLEHWDKTDYWATPIETLGTAAGDCEDYAIAKYFTLRAMGVDDEKLRLMYVRALSVNEPHMVLVYFEQPEEMPYVLDNMDPEIKLAQYRTDLRPIYSFNASGLWLAKANGLGRRVKDSSGISNWTTVLEKIEQGY